MNSSLARPEAGSRAIRLATALGVVAVATLAAAPNALAGSLFGGSTSIFFTAAADELNNVTITRSGPTTYTVTDSVPITDANGADQCVPNNATTSTCTSSSLSFVSVELGPQADSVGFAGSYASLPGFSASVDGGDGGDTLGGTDATDTFQPSLGNDTANGGGGDDRFVASAASGPDQGSDTYNGGAGTDEVTYFFRGSSVTITPGGADDGEASENDNVGADIERLDGSANPADSITGSEVDNTITGSGGNDTLRGGGGADRIDPGGGDDPVVDGGAGEDILVASIGNDAIDGGSESDSVEGGTGNDSLTGGPGNDDLQGGEGADTLNSNDGTQDDVDCGSNTDTVNADGFDTVAGDCENVTGKSFAPGQGPAGPQGGPGPQGPPGGQGPPGQQGRDGQDATRLFVSLSDSALRAKAGRTVTVRFAANAAAQVTVEVRKGSRRAARRAGSAKRGRNTLTLRLPRKARKGRSVLTLTAVSGDQRVTDRIPIVIR